MLRFVAISQQANTRLVRPWHRVQGGQKDYPNFLRFFGSVPLVKPPNPGQWLIEGEKLAGLDTQKGSLWHAYRRKWVTERKHLPDVDVAAAGGWKDTQSLKSAYQQADTETMLRVVLEAGELREVR